MSSRNPPPRKLRPKLCIVNYMNFEFQWFNINTSIFPHVAPTFDDLFCQAVVRLVDSRWSTTVTNVCQQNNQLETVCNDQSESVCNNQSKRVSNNHLETNPKTVCSNRSEMVHIHSWIMLTLVILPWESMVLDLLKLFFFLSIVFFSWTKKHTRQCTLMCLVCTIFLNKKDTHIYLSEIFFQAINAYKNM